MMGCVMREEVDRLLLVIVCAGLESLKLALRLEGEPAGFCFCLGVVGFAGGVP